MGSTPPLSPYTGASPHDWSHGHPYSPHTSRSVTPELSPDEERARRRAIVQPAFFYPNSGAADPANDKRNDPGQHPDDEQLLDPAEDPRATRGIPVFRPTMDEFEDFEAYMERVEIWGRRSGIVKIIPPREWTEGLSSTTSRLAGIKLKHPIEQHMVGKTGLFRQQNEERRHTYSVRDWAALCSKDGLRAPPPRDVIRAELKARRSRRARKGEDTAEDEEEREALTDFVEEPRGEVGKVKTSIPKDDDDFYDSLDPMSDWLPPGTSAADYTPAVCRALERHYWRNCGLGKDPMYGADMQGSLFDEHMDIWNVSHLPSALTRLLPDGNRIPGVNTPYLYFGMWRATFAWHVEDMDLYSINYIHWGAPKYWYAIPSVRACAFEQVMSKHFPTEANECPQFMRHKSFLASPAILAETDCRPNTLVQHQGEFVITYPRGYHAGFNVGFNCAESVNFALESWIEIGRRAQYCKCVGDSVHLDVDAILREKRVRERESGDNPFDALDDSLPPFNWPDPSFVRKRQPPPLSQPKSKKARTHTRSPTKDPGVVYATAAQLEQLPTIKIKIPPRMLPPLPPVPRAPKESHPYGAGVHPVGSSLPRLKIPPLSVLPCGLCASGDTTGLLPVRSLPIAGSLGKQHGPRQVHEACAHAIPETWVVESAEGKYVCGIEAIVKDRWTLKCNVCAKMSDKAHGAKIQCAKGKCPKAYHVTCAKETADLEFVSVDGTWSLDVPADEIKPGESIHKEAVTILCPQHNPRVIEARKLDKQQKLDADIGALAQYSRIKVRASGGVFAVTLVNVYEDRRTVEVVWDQGGTKEFRYTSVVWSDQVDGAVQEKPTEVAATHLISQQIQPALSTRASTSIEHDPRMANPGSGSSRGHQGASVTYPYQGYSQNTYSLPPYTYPPQVRLPSSSIFHRPTPPATDGPAPPYPAVAPLETPTQPPSGSQYTMPMPVQYPYPYVYYEQPGHPAQPQFYSAHGYYPAVTTFHAATTPAACIDIVSEEQNNSSISTLPSTVPARPTVSSYVGVKPASSQDILNGVHQTRGACVMSPSVAATSTAT